MPGPRKKTSVTIDQTLWKEFKKLAIDMNKEVSELLEDVIADTLRKRKKN